MPGAPGRRGESEEGPAWAAGVGSADRTGARQRTIAARREEVRDTVVVPDEPRTGVRAGRRAMADAPSPTRARRVGCCGAVAWGGAGRVMPARPEHVSRSLAAPASHFHEET